MGTNAETAAQQMPSRTGAASRPAVAVVVPFFGARAEAEALIATLAGLAMQPADRVVIADNTPEGVAATLATPAGVDVLVTQVCRSAYAARNEAIEATKQEWILLLDADCTPIPDICDRFFDEPPSARAGALSGAVSGAPDQPGFIAGYARARRHLDQDLLMNEHVFRPMGVTANLLVRRRAWEDVGGFAELVRSGADGDFCWRLQEAGWVLEHRPAARAPHTHRATLAALLRKAARDGAANPWLARRWPGYPRRTGVVRQLVRAAGGVPVWLVRGRPRNAAYKLVDLVWTIANDAGSLTSNATARARPTLGGATTTLFASLPERGDARLGELPDGACVEGLRRPPVVQDWSTLRRLDARLAEDDGTLTRLAALAWLAARRPLAVLRAVLVGRGEAVSLAPAARRLAMRRGPLAAGPDAAAQARLLCALSDAPGMDAP